MNKIKTLFCVMFVVSCGSAPSDTSNGGGEGGQADEGGQGGSMEVAGSAGTTGTGGVAGMASGGQPVASGGKQAVTGGSGGAVATGGRGGAGTGGSPMGGAGGSLSTGGSGGSPMGGMGGVPATGGMVGAGGGGGMPVGGTAGVPMGGTAGTSCTIPHSLWWTGKFCTKGVDAGANKGAGELCIVPAGCNVVGEKLGAKCSNLATETNEHGTDIPQHEVTFTRNLYVQRNISSINCDKLSEGAGLPVCSCDFTKVACPDIKKCMGWRRPTEDEWEYIYRAGTTTQFHDGTDMLVCKPVELGWRLPPQENEWGLIGMGRNQEYTSDEFIADGIKPGKYVIKGIGRAGYRSSELSRHQYLPDGPPGSAVPNQYMPDGVRCVRNIP